MAFVESVVKLLLEKLGDQLIQEAIFLHEVRDQVESLVAEFRGMQSFLKDAESKQEGDERVKNWVQDVRDVAYDAEDAIDTFVFNIATLRRRGFMGSIRKYSCIFNELKARHKVGSEIVRINNKISRISERRLTYGIENMGQQAGTSSTGPSLQEWRLTSPYFEEPDFVGFEKDLEALVMRLINEAELRRRVVSVVGMGGLGKTTLAKKVYNNTHVKTCFESCAWISISQEYGVRDLLKKIINLYIVLSEEDLKKVEKMDVIQLKHKISVYLQERRYLMVLDDIWTNQAWDALKDAFPDMNNGSRVLLTTRNKAVALYADAQSQPHELRFLSNEESWELFCKKTFPGRDGCCPQDLEELGRKIVEKCHGLPLAIAVIGGLLSRKEATEWENVHKSIGWQFVKGDVQISGILSLSYKDLPYYLKPCFLYLSSYPEDYEFRTKQLIQLWVAEGLVQERGELTLEEVGEDYLKELIQRSMVQVAERSSSQGIKRCRIHDLLRDLSMTEAKEGMFLQVHCGTVNAPTESRARRLAIQHNATDEYISLNRSTPHLRSVFIYTQGFAKLQKEQTKFLYRGFKLLRVLYLHRVWIKELPWEIGELIHLRYFGCPNTSLKSLPSSIGNLANLQTLYVTSSNFSSIKVPSTIGKMQQLRHLQVKGREGRTNNTMSFSGWGEIEGQPRLEGIGNLQTLSGVKAGKWMEGCLGKLINLRKLGIVLLGTTADAEVFNDSIVKLGCLHSLSVSLGTVSQNSRNSDVSRSCHLSVSPHSHLLKLSTGKQLETPGLLVPTLSHLLKLSKLYLDGNLDKLPASAEFPTNLTKLTLVWSELKQDPLATLEKLKNLRILRLLKSSYSGKEMACAAQGFPRLESLLLEGLYGLEEWRVEEGAMPSLLHLRIIACLDLKKLPEGLQHVTTLRKLELRSMHAELKYRLREDGGEDWDKIQHIPSIDISDRYV